MNVRSTVDGTEWVEEEYLVHVELTGVLDQEYFAKSNNECKILGIDTEQPVMQVGNYIFTGEYKKTIGTSVFFEEETNEAGKVDKANMWKYKCHTDKKLEMTRAFLKPKETVTDQSGQQSTDVETPTDMEVDQSGT